MALPKAFDERIRIQLGDEYEDYIKCFDSDMYHGIKLDMKIENLENLWIPKLEVFLGKVV